MPPVGPAYFKYGKPICKILKVQNWYKTLTSFDAIDFILYFSFLCNSKKKQKNTHVNIAQREIL